MTDTSQQASSVQGVYPPWNIPTVYADAVLNVFRGGGSVKFYLARLDPDITAKAQANPTIFAQIVMPAVGFAQLTVFFQQQLEVMIQANEISQAVVDELRAGGVKVQPSIPGA